MYYEADPARAIAYANSEGLTLNDRLRARVSYLNKRERRVLSMAEKGVVFASVKTEGGYPGAELT